ncbi:MAG: nucleotide exchange factor GrpE [Haliea sp.]|uniref:nucleotide exchange factor GrpE n=1 Tax=Haliea sp. TaxID=1932666 RepID=UPI000C442274|nr:nucleotide exchange factor GrpE [Haliea sp.]MBM69811.1 nucleotide exchange factor GrpE [Haliea sp.]
MAENEQNTPESEPGEGGNQRQAAEAAAYADTAASTQPEAAEGSEEPTPEALMAALEEDLNAARDAALRAQADAQNIKRRAEQDVEKARKFALESFCKELLPVVDNMERALAVTAGHDESVKPIIDGLELTLKSFVDALRKFHIEPVDPEGQPFDPQLHQAMSLVENAEVEPNTVIAVMQKGYTLNSRLVRPAMVMVSKAPTGE